MLKMFYLARSFGSDVKQWNVSKVNNMLVSLLNISVLRLIQQWQILEYVEEIRYRWENIMLILIEKNSKERENLEKIVKGDIDRESPLCDMNCTRHCASASGRPLMHAGQS